MKALIASESSFRENLRIKAGKHNFANGLMQVTDQSLVALRNEDGEIKDQYITITQKEALDPDANICAGVRWLFQKQRLASGKLGRNASWDEMHLGKKPLANTKAQLNPMTPKLLLIKKKS